MPEQDQTYYVLTDEQLRQLADDAAAGVASDVGTAVDGARESLSSQLSTMGSEIQSAAVTGTVALTDQQFGELEQLMSSQLHGLLYVFGALMFFLGLYGITQVVRHWRAG